jgi:methionine--tRNA ligase beta chain
MKISLGANIIYVSDLPRAKAWYEKHFGMKTVEYRPPEFLEMRLGDATFYIETENPKRAEGFKEVTVGGVSSAIIAVDDLKALVEKMRLGGVKIVTEPVRQFWGGWNAKIADPDGNIFILDQDEVSVSTTITFGDLEKVELKVGQILTAEKIPATDKLLRLTVDFGTKMEMVAQAEAKKTDMLESKDIRQVVSGISFAFPDPLALVGKKFAFVTNLEPRKIKGFESQAMILATGEGETFSLFAPTKDAPSGSALR